ncbi:NADAR family protein [Streptomyces sp. HSG2]|uniref:NADAR family protein n=1 Tax=Streptomyces sp. HSG2 TaxID=2797167 RepID=UPI001906F11F|nr:NADAR family protein [Streptomyces sp. HSG2]
METVDSRDPTKARTREDLATLVAGGARPKWLMFWGHRPRRPGSVDSAVLSQWWPSAFTVDGVTYPSAEHWMMAGKARLFDDAAALPAILSARHPAEAKKRGRLVRAFDETRWAAARFELVVTGNVAKFGQDPTLCSYLLGTRGRVLVEASPTDRVWGIGLGTSEAGATDPTRWPGLNLLGFALMEARAWLDTEGGLTE